jgi:hypothetical protein
MRCETGSGLTGAAGDIVMQRNSETNSETEQRDGTARRNSETAMMQQTREAGITVDRNRE